MPKLRLYENQNDVKPRLRARRRGNQPPRYYADFRDFKDVGGDWEALIPDGQHHATTDAAEAERLAAGRLAELRSGSAFLYSFQLRDNGIGGRG